MPQDRVFSATAMPDRDWWQALWPDPEMVVKALGIRCGMEVVDLGCGYGHFTAAVARQAGPGRVIAIDIDPDMVAQAQAACQQVSNCIWIQGDAMELPRLVPDPVDFVLLDNTFHGAPDKPTLASTIRSILRPEGRLAIVNWHPVAREHTVVKGLPRGPETQLRMSLAQTCAAVEPVGFSLDMTVDLPPYHYGAIFIQSLEYAP